MNTKYIEENEYFEVLDFFYAATAEGTSQKTAQNARRWSKRDSPREKVKSRLL